MKTVAQLIEELQKFPQDKYVVMASDEEGNDFHPWYDIGHGQWDKQDREFSSWTYDDIEDESTERAITLDESNSICLWP